LTIDNKTNQLNEKYSIKNGIAGTIVLNVSNNYFALFAIGVLGASNYQVSLINSLPQFIGMFAMVLCSILMGKLNEKKRFTAYSILFTRLFFIFMFFVLYIPDEYQSWVFVLLVGCMNFPGSFANLSWQAFIGDLIPDFRRSGFFGDRNKILTVVGMASTFIFGLLLQQFDKSNPLPYKILFLIALFSGLIEVYYLTKHIEIKKENVIVQEKKEKVINWNAFRDKPFVYFMICGLFFNFAWQMAWSLFSIYQIKDAHANGMWISLFSVANQVAQVLSFKWWGRMADKYSNAKMMILVAIGMASTPILTILSSNLIYLTMVNATSGLFVSGTVLILFNQLLEVTNDNNRSSYIANYNVLLAIVGFIAPQFGVFLLEQTNMDIAMIISGVLRASSAIFFFSLYCFLKKKKVKSEKMISTS
jgi:MFS family permease